MKSLQDDTGRSSVSAPACPATPRPHRMLTKALLASGTALSLVLTSCSGAQQASAPANAAPDSSKAVSSIENYQPTAGTDLPVRKVRYGLLPYGDNSMPVIGMQNQWFKDAGLDIDPQPVGTEVQDAQVVPRLVNDELDVVNWDATVLVQQMVAAPQIRELGFTDTYIGTYLLARPGSGLKSVSELVSGGASFDDAVKQAMGQLKGKRVALDNTGYHRPFYNTVLEMGSMQADSMQLTTIDDAKMVQLAKGGELDVASPVGAAQNVELLNLGWYPVVGADDLVKGLPVGDARAAAALNHVGPAVNEKLIVDDPAAALRIASVNFRIIDGILDDPDKTLGVQLPYLNSVTGGNYTLGDIKMIYTKLDPPTRFEDQVKYWTQPDNPMYYKNVYNPQIKAAQEGGALPADLKLDASQSIVGETVYKKLVALKAQYDGFQPDLAKLTDPKSVKTRDAAAVFYAQRNYVDAVRYGLAALGR